MIQTPKPRSFKFLPFLVSSLLLLLAGFFVYATRVDTRFFVFLSLALAVNVAVLLFSYRRFKGRKAVLKLQREEYAEKANLLKADLQQEAAAIASFREKIVSYGQLKGLLEKLGMCLSLDDVILTLCRETVALFDPRDITVILYLVDPATGGIAIVHASRNHHAISVKMKQGDMFDRWCLKALQPLVVQDTRNDFRFDAEKAEDEDRRQVRSLLSVPLLVHNKPIGILRLDSVLAGRFAEDDLRFLKTIGDVAAVALENAQLYDRVEDLAIRDSLTGLFLRRYLMERMAEEVPRHLRREKPLAFVMFDLDHFKSYNDRFGHPAGDILLKAVAELLRTHFGDPGMLVCRYGGEEFCVLMPECAPQDALARAEAFVERVARQDIVLRRENTRITVSAGVAGFPEQAKTREELIARADEALYEAKRNGRDRACLSS
ncbi:MAG: sensor domain-containing diguanylate cyclase [Candidatus Omnitrophota bacterium]